MGTRNKFMGVIAAAALTLSMFAGAAASNPSEDPSVLNAGPNPDGVCSISLSESTVNFGTFAWDGDSFEVVGDQPTLDFELSQNIGPGVTCNVNAKASALTHTTDNTKKVTVGHLSLRQGTGQGAVSGTHHFGGWTSSNGPTIVIGGEGGYSFNLVVGNRTYSIPALGTYEGEVNIFVSQNTGP